MLPLRDEHKKALKLPSLFLSFGVIVALLLTISVVNVTIRGLFGHRSSTAEKAINLIYDKDFYVVNWTRVCPILKTKDIESHDLEWRETPCFNKTLLFWYNPWVKDWVWKEFDEVTQERKRLKIEIARLKLEALRKAAAAAEKNESIVVESTTEGPKEEEKDETVSNKDNKKEEPSSLVYTALSAMVLMSTILACLEVFKEKYGKKVAEEERSDDRRCSLADFTMKRHIRKESQQESLQRQGAVVAEEPKKVTRLLHQGSLDRALVKLTGAVRRLPRQSSVPTQMTSSSTSAEQPLSGVPNQLRRNPSVDTSEDECSPNMRRRSRHFIRRH